MRRFARLRQWNSLLVIFLTIVTAFIGAATICSAQQGGPGQGGNQGGGNQIGGILIDAEGVVHSIERSAQSSRLQHAAREAFLAEKLHDDLISFSDRRHVSLVRLERECKRLLQAGESIDEPIQYLAGLQRIDYLFFDQDTADIVIAGPAEGFAPDSSGRIVGLTTGRPPLRLEDLIVAMQSANSGVRAIGCSIDPDPERLAEMQRFIQQNSSPTSPAGAVRRYQEMARILGRQNVSVFGVPADSHFAVTLIEADYRMKRISLGIEPSGVRGLVSHLAMITPGGNSIQRWWFVPNYEGLFATDDRMAFQLSGQRVQLLAQDEVTNAGGERSDAAVTRASTHKFAQLFTSKFPELAERSPLFAELQNLFDLAIIAALMEQDRLADRIGWDRSLFSQAGPPFVSNYAVPRHVESMTTFRRAGRGVVLGLIGGVTIESRRVLHQLTVNSEHAPRLDGTRRAAFESVPEDNQTWWWD